MKLMASGVAICAGMTRSPSFSRSSSSTRMNMRPLRASSISSSGLERKPCFRRARSAGLDTGTQGLHALKIASQHVDFEVDRPALLQIGESRHFGSVRDDVESEA